MKKLIDKKIVKSEINEEKDIVKLTTDDGVYFLSWVGECCAKCYLASVSGSDFLNNSIILEVENAEWSRVIPKEDNDVVDSMGSKIKTSLGYVTFESRVEHNGYYSGKILISENAPLDQYHGVLDEKDFIFEELKDYD